jgi:hypothetical protein
MSETIDLEPHSTVSAFDFKAERLPSAFKPGAPVSCFQFLLTAAKRRFSSRAKRMLTRQQQQQQTTTENNESCTNCTHFTAQLWLSCGLTDITVHLLHTNDALFPSDFLLCRQHFTLISSTNKKKD